MMSKISCWILKCSLVGILLGLWSDIAISQGIMGHYTRYDRAYSILQREARSQDLDFHSAVGEIPRSIDTLLTQQMDTTSGTRAKLLNSVSSNNKLLEDKPGGFLKSFYYNSFHFLEVNTEDFKLVIQPILSLSITREAGNATLFSNRRGLQLYGQIAKNIYFRSELFDTQARYSSYINRYVSNYSTIPGQGFFKNYQSSVFEGVNGYDYNNASAHIGLKINRITALELGHGKQFVGDGMRSILLDDFHHNYFYIKLKFKVWKLYYESTLTELASIAAAEQLNEDVLSKKYMNYHYLSYRPNNRFEIGLFESVVYGREDQLELQYFNPIILYRSVEQFINSPDNVLLGINTSWVPKSGFKVYGQFMLDDIIFSELRDRPGFWGNKLGWQLGMYYDNVLTIKNLDIQLEYNAIRPYTYSHRHPVEGHTDRTITSYSHHNQALAHPLGANFWQMAAQLNYSVTSRLGVNIYFRYDRIGRDMNGINYGQNILLNHNTRTADRGIDLVQGAISDIYTFQSRISYEFVHNYYIDLYHLYRREDNNNISLRDAPVNQIGISIRANHPFVNSYL